MQNPIKKLKQSRWYQVATSVILHQKDHPHSKKITTIPVDSMVMFLEYSDSSVRKCRVLYQDTVGWLFVDNKYKQHTHFFKEVKLDAEDK